MVAFSQLRKADPVFVSISFEFSSNLKRDAPFHRTAFDYSPTDWDGLCDQ